MVSADEARQLDRLAIGTAAAAPAMAASGMRHARMRGQGLEFQDFRHYQPGDDPRSIDWTVDARLRQLVVRVYSAEGQVQLHLLLDVSRSMTAGSPSKLACAKKIAAALAYLAVERRDAVGIATFDAAIRAHIAPASGRPQLFRVFGALESIVADGSATTDHALIDYGTAVRGPGLAVVLSDFFHADSTLDGLRYLIYRDLTPAVIQVVAPEELQPDIPEDVDLGDLEDPSAPPVPAEAASIAAYLQELARVSSTLETFCLRHGLPWLRVASSAPFDRILTACQQAGLLAARG
jgi:uncharacterized protein (DUF58 family)